MSPILLKRAKAIASEHSKLSAQLVEGFDSKIAKRVGELASASHALREWEKAIEVRRALSYLHNARLSPADY